MKGVFCFSLILLFLCACSTSRVSYQQLEKAKLRFLLATNRIGPQGAAIVDHQLSAIGSKDQNEQGYVPMLAWKNKADADQFYAAVGSLDTFSSSYLTWVTKKSEMRQKVKALKLQRFSRARLALRMEQLLGLAPQPQSDTNRVFIEIWVKEADLFRPCRDPEISDLFCSLSTPAGAYTRTSPAYDSIYQELIQNNLRNEPPADAPSYWAPWTRMGYTYDWHPRNKTHLGMSEYIIRRGAVVMIKAKTRTEEWLRMN